MKVVIIGAGDIGRLVTYILSYQKEIEIVGFVDDDKTMQGLELNGVKVLGSFSILSDLIEEGVTGAICSIGDNKIRGMLNQKAKKLGLKIKNAIHPTAIISPHVMIGEGVIIAAGTTVSWNPTIGNNVYIAPGAIITHDAVIEDNVLISPGAIVGAFVRVKKNAFIATGATIMTGVKTIGENATVGAGAVVVGIPAKVIKYKINKNI